MYDLRHRTIFETMLGMNDRREAVDPITVRQKLKDAGKLEEVGGDQYLGPLPDRVPSAANLKYYADIVWDKFILRQMIRTCTEIVGQAYDTQDVSSLVDRAETAVLAVRGRNGTEMREPKEVVREAIGKIEEMHANQGALTGLPSGFADLDALTWGFQPEMYVIAGFTSTGKTTIAMQFAAHVALEARIPTGVFSLEMDAATLMTRTLTANAGVDIYDIREGKLSGGDFPKLTAAAGRLAGANNLWIDDSPYLTIGQMKAKARRMVSQHGIRLIVVDQVSLVEGGDEESRQMQIDRINLACQQISRELKVPVFAIAQLNEQGELRESRAGAQHGGAVLKLEPLKPLKETIGEKMIEMDLLVTKLRNGRTGKVGLVFDKAHTRFLPRAKIADEDVPPPTRPARSKWSGQKQPTLPNYDRD
jgi:replicative DNA helicase